MKVKALKDDAQAERFGRWLKAIGGDADHIRWCADAGIPVVKADVEGINSAGGWLVPQDFAPIIISLREPASVFRANARVVPMRSDTTTVPRRVSGVTAAWATESNTGAESQTSVDALGLTAKKLSAYVKASNELVEDAVGLANFVASEIAYAFAGKEDDAGFNGDGTSAYGGITGLTQKLLGASLKSKIAAASTHNTFLLLDNTDLANLIAGVMAAALPGAKWYMSQIAFATTLCRLAGVSGGLTWQVLNGAVVPYYLGFPVVVTPKLPTTTSAQTGAVMMLFGDLSMAATVGDRRGVTVDVSTQRYLDTDQTAYRGTERVDIVVNDIGDTSVVGPIAALIGTA